MRASAIVDSTGVADIWSKEERRERKEGEGGDGKGGEGMGGREGRGWKEGKGGNGGKGGEEGYRQSVFHNSSRVTQLITEQNQLIHQLINQVTL